MDTLSIDNPLIIKRLCGGWLAVTRREVRLRIGVAADSEEEARKRFSEAVRQWATAKEAELADQQAPD